MLQSKPGRSGKQEQEHNSPNVEPAFSQALYSVSESLPESSSRPLPAKWPNHTTWSLFNSKSLYVTTVNLNNLMMEDINLETQHVLLNFDTVPADVVSLLPVVRHQVRGR